MLQRVAKVSADAVALARAVALFPTARRSRTWPPLPGSTSEAAADAADGLMAVQVLADDERLAFLHPVMRTAVYDELGAFARRRGHARAAALLKQRGAPAEEIAAHLLAGSPAATPTTSRSCARPRDGALAASRPAPPPGTSSARSPSRRRRERRAPRCATSSGGCSSARPPGGARDAARGAGRAPTGARRQT